MTAKNFGKGICHVPFHTLEKVCQPALGKAALEKAQAALEKACTQAALVQTASADCCSEKLKHDWV